MEPSCEIKLKIFQVVREKLAMIGIAPNQQQNNRLKLNLRQTIFVGTAVADAILNICYFYFETIRTKDYMDVVLCVTNEVGVLISFFSLIVKGDKGFNTIELCETELIHSK